MASRRAVRIRRGRRFRHRIPDAAADETGQCGESWDGIRTRSVDPEPGSRRSGEEQKPQDALAVDGGFAPGNGNDGVVTRRSLHEAGRRPRMQTQRIRDRNHASRHGSNSFGTRETQRRRGVRTASSGALSRRPAWSREHSPAGFSPEDSTGERDRFRRSHHSIHRLPGIEIQSGSDGGSPPCFRLRGPTDLFDLDGLLASAGRRLLGTGEEFRRQIDVLLTLIER